MTHPKIEKLLQAHNIYLFCQTIENLAAVQTLEKELTEQLDDESDKINSQMWQSLMTNKPTQITFDYENPKIIITRDVILNQEQQIKQLKSNLNESIMGEAELKRDAELLKKLLAERGEQIQTLKESINELTDNLNFVSTTKEQLKAKIEKIDKYFKQDTGQTVYMTKWDYEQILKEILN